MPGGPFSVATGWVAHGGVIGTLRYHPKEPSWQPLTSSGRSSTRPSSGWVSPPEASHWRRRQPISKNPPTTVETPDAAAKPEGVDVGAKSDDQHDADEVPNYTSSVTVPVTPDAPEGAEGSEADEAKADKAELAKLEKVAKIDAKAASKAATDKVPGTAAKPELDEEHGNVVYEVDVTAKDGTVTEVIVDAGNGRVLAQQAD